MSNLTPKQSDSNKTTSTISRKPPLSLAERLAIPEARSIGTSSANKGQRSPSTNTRTPERLKAKSPKQHDAPALPATLPKKQPPPPLNSSSSSRSIPRPTKLSPLPPTTPRSLAAPNHQPSLTTPSPTSASSSQFRTKRGGGKRPRHKDTPTILVENPKPQSIEDAIASMTISKPQSIEDAIAQMKSNPFGGRPPKSPLLQPRPQNSLPPPSPGSIAKTLSVPEQDSKHEEPETKTLEEEDAADDTHAQYLTLSTPSVAPSISRPHTPSVHIDWAGDDDDNSLPDLDDWVTQSSIAPLKNEESGMEAHRQVGTDPDESQKQQQETGHSGIFSHAGQEEDKPHRETPSAADAKDVFTVGVKDETTKPFSSDGEHPVEADSAGPVRVFLPASRSRLFNRQLAAVSTPIPDNANVADDKSSNDNLGDQVPTPNSQGLRPSPPVASLDVRNKVEVSPERRPASVSSSPIPPLKLQQFNNAFHARTRSLPQTGRGSPNHPRVHMHSTRPILSQTGLSRISRTLAASGLVAPSSSKIREASPVAVE